MLDQAILTTTELAIGDALAVVLRSARKCTPEDVAVLYPGSMLGRKLLLKLEDVMYSGAEISNE